MYYLYHIPGKKIGVTCNLKDRVTKQQGYNHDEYEVLFTSNDIDYISYKEIELQRKFGYKIDRQTYKDLINNKKKKCTEDMNINITNQTTTFPYPLNKLKGQLMDNIGVKWETHEGSLEINTKTIPWILENSYTSMYNDTRCYVYNKPFSDFCKSLNEKCLSNDKGCERFDLIRDWAQNRGIYDTGDSKTQYIKLMEEAGELARGLLKKDKAEIIDAIGDIVVVLTNLAALEKLKIEDCVDSAYNVIKSRKGKMVNGTFVKQTL